MMKRIPILILMLAFGLCCEAQTELYNRYASRTDIKVACVNNMQLDSTSHIEVTILQATDDTSWRWILNEFNIGAQPADQMSVMFSMRDRHDPSKSAPIRNEVIDQDNLCYIGVDFSDKSLYVFAALCGTSPDILLKYLVNKMSKQK